MRIVKRRIDQGVDRQVNEKERRVKNGFDHRFGRAEIGVEKEESKEHAHDKQVDCQHNHTRKGCF